MSTKTALSVTIQNHNLGFLEKLVKEKSTTKSGMIDAMLDWWRKYYLKKDLIECFKNQTEEDVEEAMADLDEYLSNLDKDDL